MKHLLFNLKHLFSLLSKNLFRSTILFLGFFLTSFGVSASDVIASNISLSESVYYENFPRNSLLIKSHITKESYTRFNKSLLDIKSCPIYQNYSYLSKLKTEETSITLAEFHVPYNFSFFPLISADNSESLEQSEILYGRSFSSEEYTLRNRSIIIHNMTASFLLKTKNVLGNYLPISSGGSTTLYKIVGVLKDTPSVIRIYKDFTNKDKKRLVPVYLPNYTNNINNIVCVTKSPINESYIEQLKLTSSPFISQGVSSFFCYDSHYKRIQRNLNDSKVIVNIILFILYSNCLLFIASLMSFFLKERITEIGIRKALGANANNILFQFMFELLLISFFAGVLGVILGNFVGSIASWIITAFFGQPHVKISFQSFLLPLLINIFVGLLSGLIPSIIASKKTSKECLQNE